MVIVMHDGGYTLWYSVTQGLLGHRAVHRALRGHPGARFGIQVSLHLSCGIGIWGWRTVRFHLLAYAALAMACASLSATCRRQLDTTSRARTTQARTHIQYTYLLFSMWPAALPSIDV